METTNAVTKYIVKRFNSDGKFAGYLSLWDANGMMIFCPEKEKAQVYNNKEIVKYFDGTAWDDGKSDETGYYEIETIGVIDIGDLNEYIIKKKQKAVDELIEKYNLFTPEQKEQFKNQIK